MDGKNDLVASPWQAEDVEDSVLERQSAILQENIRKSNIRHHNEKTALERQNTRLLTAPPCDPNTKRSPRSSATVPTQEATVPFHEHKELEYMYNELLRENDELRQNSAKLAKQHEGMKARVKEWNAWATKRAKRGKGRGEPAKGKTNKGYRADLTVPSTPISITSPFHGARQTSQPGEDTEDLHEQIAEQASRILKQHDSPSRRLRSGRTGSPGHQSFLEGIENDFPHDLPETYYRRNVRQAPDEVSSDPPALHSHQADLESVQDQATVAFPKVTSSQTTQDADDVQGQMQAFDKPGCQLQSDDEEPTIVSERSLKRKHPALIEVYQDPPERRTEPPQQIKEELRETQPGAFAAPALLHRASTIDLDEVGLQIQTPRKRRRMQDILRNSQLSGAAWSRPRPPLRQERSSSLPLGLARATSAEDVKEEESDANVVLEVPDSDPSPRAEEDRGCPEAVDITLVRSPENPRKTNALKSRDVNIGVQPQVTKFRTHARHAEDEKRGAKAASMPSEGGEETQIRELSPAKMQESRRRFAELYDNPPPERQVLASPRTPASGRPTRTTARANAGKNSDKSTPRARSAATDTKSKKKVVSAQLPTPVTSTRTTRSANGPRSLRKQQQKAQSPSPSLRLKPLAQLQLSDFKINPNTNAGLDFAYSEVVRSREARQCLPGCTKPDCCGRDLRAMVEAGLNPPLPRSFWDDSQPTYAQTFVSDKEAQDHRYLQWFQGTSYDRDRVDAMPSAMRDDLVVQAKVKLLASQAGKHRHAHQRPRTPPGFWRADFPGTQEREKDREEARKREREAVEERWREAMIEGGRWIFRDE
ncbi:DNA repair protein endonuclease SAE2/CtIP C-terminus-domain-containing protein [Macrophomina phaseolina]|uniref:DNA repair protein endonuclease SAE2/CtIP C-terminus-domain-containing protein n=1 Tax=Macrophomina phaseolina TaxID=35725 RepID=A0ABQ8G6Z4_9PEZI|nr:DNA repair protein endonuclease SAE2/CtIP C-terminus-domain-containing protein [Macrophomina phaseolina]